MGDVMADENMADWINGWSAFDVLRGEFTLQVLSNNNGKK